MHVPAVSCDVCGKPTSRLHGFAAVVSIPVAEGEPELTRFRSSARGFCLAHREQIAPRFLADALAEGDVVWQAPEPLLLRPAELDGFHRQMEQMARDLGEEIGLDPSATYRKVQLTPDGGIDLPTSCPHCNGRLSWGTGPHVRDAAERKAASGFGEAWECLDCGAAGLLAGH